MKMSFSYYTSNLCQKSEILARGIRQVFPPAMRRTMASAWQSLDFESTTCKFSQRFFKYMIASDAIKEVLLTEWKVFAFFLED